MLEGFAPVLQHHLMLALEKSPFLRGAAGGPGGSAGGRRADGLFQILLRCQQSPGASCHLLAEGLREHAPILSVLAACFPVSAA